MNKPNINLKYREQDGMMLPDLQISNSSEADQPLGRYGRMALEYLRENHPQRFTTLKMDGSLMEIMHRVQDEDREDRSPDPANAPAGADPADRGLPWSGRAT